MAAKGLDTYGAIDILVNNAGMYSSIKKRPFTEIPLDEWDRCMAVNVKGVFLCCRAVHPQMKKQGKGKIINISSGTGARRLADVPALRDVQGGCHRPYARAGG